MAIHVIEKQASNKLAAMQAEDARKRQWAETPLPPPSAAPPTNGQLVAFLERIERVEEDKRALSEDLKEIYAEAKGSGFDTKIIRKLIALRRLDEEERMQADQLLESYMRAAGMAVQTSMAF